MGGWGRVGVLLTFCLLEVAKGAILSSAGTGRQAGLHFIQCHLGGPPCTRENSSHPTGLLGSAPMKSQAQVQGSSVDSIGLHRPETGP